MSYPYVYLDGIYLKRNWGGSYENVAVLVAMAVNSDGQREVIGAAEGMKEDKESWLNFLVGLKSRGLTGTQLFIGDKCLGLLEAVNTVYPDAKYQRLSLIHICHFYTHRGSRSSQRVNWKISTVIQNQRISLRAIATFPGKLR